MRCSDDERRRRHPTAAGDPQAARGPEHADDARGGASHAGRTQQPRIGRCDRRRGPGDRREGVDTREQPHEPRGRNGVVESAQNERPLRGATKRRLSGDEQRRGADDPDECEPGSRAEHEPADRIEHSQRRQRQRPAKRSAGQRPHCLEQYGAGGRARETGERRVRRVRAAGEQVRREPRADDRADDNPGERERAGDEPLVEPEQRRERNEHQREPVDSGHGDGG